MKSIQFNYLILLLFMWSCQSPEGQTSAPKITPAADELSQEERNAILQQDLNKLIDFKDLGVVSTDNKWELNLAVGERLNQLFTKVYVLGGNFDNYELDQLNEEAGELHEITKKIKLDSENPAEKELAKVISEVNTQVLIMSGGNKKNAQIAVVNLGRLMDGLRENFIVVE